MKPTTNIYILADVSLPMSRNAVKLQTIFTRMARSLSFANEKTELHLIGYRDRACNFSPYDRVRTNGNPNLGEGLKYLKSVMRYVQKYNGKKTRSIFLWYSSGEILYGWKNALNELFKTQEFAYGLRYVVACGRASKEAERAYAAFTDSHDRVLSYFSESRLCSLVENIQRQEAQLPRKM